MDRKIDDSHRHVEFRSAVALGALSVLVMPALGCSYFTHEVGRPLAVETKDWTVGTTHHREILETLGPPDQISATPTGFAYLYEFVRTREYQIGFNVDQPTLRWFKAVAGKGVADREAVFLTFGHDGILDGKRSIAGKEDLATGFGMQLVFVAKPAIDTSDLTGEATQHDWGLSLLRRPPETLNEAQSLESGQNGLEQLGTPTGAGQHSVELRRSRKSSSPRYKPPTLPKFKPPK